MKDELLENAEEACRQLTQKLEEANEIIRQWKKIAINAGEQRELLAEALQMLLPQEPNQFADVNSYDRAMWDNARNTLGRIYA